MLKTSLYLAVNFVALAFLCLSCSTHKAISQESNIKADFYNEFIGVVLDYQRNKHGFFYTKDSKPCYILNPVVEVTELSVYYNYWHYHLLEQRKSIDSNNSFMSKNLPGLVLDTLDLKKKVYESFNLSKVGTLGHQCIQYDQSNGKEEGVISFTPIIKMNKEGYYFIAFSITSHLEFPEFFFIVAKQKDENLKVIDHIWGDDWPTLGIGDEIDILKRE